MYYKIMHMSQIQMDGDVLENHVDILQNYVYV